MLGYSAITHAGFIALAVGSGPNGPATAAFYAAVYATMAMLVFAALAGTRERSPDLRSLGRLRAMGLALGLFSLSGIPPTPGFWAKLAVLMVAWQSAGVWPTLIAVAGGVFSVLYYLRPLPELLAALRGDAEAPAPARWQAAPGVILALATLVVLGLFPGLIWSLTST
jgi:NADH-quinone oxidoreductase subunit N